MAFIPWPNSIKCVLEFTVAGIPVTVTIAVTKPTPIVTSDVPAVASAARAWFATAVLPNLSTLISFNRVTAYDMTSSTGTVHVDTTGLPLAGAVAGPVTDIGSAFDISFRTPNRGRSGRGRNYVPGMASNNRADAAKWMATPTTDIAVDYAALSTYMATPGFDHTVASEQLNGVVRNPAVMQSVTSYLGNINIANQRRRGLWTG